MTIRLDHVQIAIPAGAEDDARHFFGQVLGLVEVAKPDNLVGRGGCWFALGDHELHVGIDPDFRAAKKAHVALVVDDLDALRHALLMDGRIVHDDAPIAGRRRFFTEDPSGNRLELVEYDAGSRL